MQFNMEKATIGLSIIVKDEEKVILRLLESIYKILDYYIIVDTGSTDNTKKIVEEFMSSKGVPGEVVDHKWVDFGTARNFAMDCIKGKASHGFWIDADEYLEYDKGFNLETLKTNLAKFDQASVEVNYNSTRYTRSQFWRTDLPFYWYGPVHEVIMCNQKTNMAVLKGLTVIVKAEGNSWTSMTQQEKYEKDAKLLEKYVAEDPKKDPRWVFYLAQSYRDAIAPENLKKSIEWYSKRRDMVEGYPEERYYSQLMVATLKGRLTYPEDEVLREFNRCANYDLARGEHFIPIIRHYHAKKEWHSAYILSQYCFKKYHKKNPYPSRSLFIDPSVYDWKFADLHSISAYYMQSIPESRKAMNQATNAITKGLVQDPDKTRIKGNLKFFKK
jgi:glycosyltransferase involved in cell wall biosynthesis